MAFLLNIDTAVTTASVCFSRNGQVIRAASSPDPRNHAAWLHTAIQEISQEAGLSLQELDGVAVSIGPGSYTGLRVGLSAAKGFCFALNIPLITVGTLEMMASKLKGRHEGLICPLMDARRMEVFTAVYDQSLHPVIAPCAMIIDKDSFSDLLTRQSIIFAGNGREKLKQLVSDQAAIFTDDEFGAEDMVSLSTKCFIGKNFADLAYTEPLYIKEFYFPNSR